MSMWPENDAPRGVAGCGDCGRLAQMLLNARQRYDWSGVTDARVLQRRHLRDAHADATGNEGDRS